MAGQHHKCPVDPCGRYVPFGRLMCWSHWRMVPRDLQRLVWAQWNNGHIADPGAYLKVRQEAIDAVKGAIS